MTLCKSCNFENPDGLEFCDQCQSPLSGIDDVEASDNANQLSQVDVGQVIGMRYIIMSEPAKVSFGEVFDGEDASDDSDVSLYLAPDYVASNQRILAELKSVTAKVAGLSHDHLQSMLDSDLEGDRKFLVYDKLSGQNLADKVDQGPLSVEEALSVFTQVAQALDYLHSREIICGDVTPENIIIDENGAVKLAYPGVSKIIKDAAVIASVSADSISIHGALTALEQLEGNAVRRSDIYSFAACICISLGGYLEGDRFMSLGVLSESQNSALRNALSSNGLSRPGTCGELLEDMGVEKSSIDWEMVKLCSVSVTADSSGQIFLPVRPGVKFDFGAEIEVKAVPASNHHFISWGGSAVEAGKLADPGNPITKLTIDGDCTLNAVFKINTHVLKLSCSGSGLISEPLEDDIEFDHGCEVTVKATADHHHHFVNWIGSAVDEGKVADPTSAITTVNVDSDYSLEANFEVDCFTLDLSAYDGGLAFIGGLGETDGPDATSQVFQYGSTVTIIAQGKDNHHFIEWTGSAVDLGLVEDSTLKETTVTVQGDCSLSAVFEVDSYAFALSSTHGGSLGGYSEGFSEIAHGRVVQIKANSDKNHHFVKWTGSAVDKGIIQDSENPVVSLEIDDDYSLEAVFAIDRYSFSLQQSDGGNVEISDAGISEYDHGSKVSVVAKADENYHFVEWAGSAVDARKVQSLFSPNTTVTIDGEYSLSAVFAIERHVLNLSSVGGGSVTEPSEGFSEYDYGRQVFIKAAANEHHHFVEWAGFAADEGKLADKNSSETSLTIDGGISLEAVFAIDQHCLSLNSNDGGNTKIASEEAEKYDHGSKVEIIATANENYHFAEWTGLTVDEGKLADKNSAETLITIDGYTRLEAVFAIDRHSLTLSSNEGGVACTAADKIEKYDHGFLVEVVATADENYHFVEWAGSAVDNGWLADSQSSATNIISHGDMTVHAIFAIDQKTLTVNPGDGGLVTLPGCGQYCHAYGEEVVIECYANEKYHFVNWTGSAVDNGKVSDPASPKTTIDLTGNYNVIAVFEKDKLMSRAIAFAKSSYQEPKIKVIAAALLAAIILISAIMGLKNSSNQENILERLWKDAQQKAQVSDFDRAITTAANILELSKDFAEDENIQVSLDVWKQQLIAQQAWLEVDKLVGQSKFAEAMVKAQAFIRDFPESKFAENAKKQERQLEKILAIEERISRASKLNDSGQPAAALPLILSIFNDSPGNGSAALLRMQIEDKLQEKEDNEKTELVKSAERFVNNSDWGKAINYYTKALEIAPGDDQLKDKLSLCRHNLYLAEGIAAEKDKDYESAIQSYRFALSFKQVDATTEKLKSARKALELAQADKQKSITLNKLTQMAAEAHQNENYAVAISIYGKIIESYPTTEGIADLLATAKHDLHLSLAISLKNVGKLPQALVSFNEALSFRNVESTQQQHDLVLEQFQKMQNDYNEKKQIANWLEDAKDAEKTGDDGKIKALGFYESAANAGSPEAMVALGDALYEGSGVEVDAEKAVQWFKKAAEAEYGPVYCRLGVAYAEGKGKSRNIPAAFECFKKGADFGSGRSMYYLSRAYHDGQGTERDLAKAKDWLIKSAGAGDLWGMHNLAILYHKGIGEKKDIDNAVVWYEKAAKAGNVDAMYNLGAIYFKGDEVTKDETKGMWWLTRSAENGNADAILRFGLAYHDGIGVAVNYPAAMKWLTKAAGNGNVEAMYRLGNMFSQGYGTEKAPAKAIEYFTKAAESGSVVSMYNLAVIYFEGLGVKQDYEKAVKWFSASADAGDLQSMYYMGVVCNEGLGANEDKAKAFQWFSQAANEGYPKAMYDLAIAYDKGYGVENDQKMAFQWIEKAAKAGSHEAIYQLAVMYEEGINVEQDLYESVRWFQKAANLGNEAAKGKLADLNEIW